MIYFHAGRFHITKAALKVDAPRRKRMADQPAPCTSCSPATPLPPSSFTVTKAGTLSSWCRACQRENTRFWRRKQAARKAPSWAYTGAGLIDRRR